MTRRVHVNQPGNSAVGTEPQSPQVKDYKSEKAGGSIPV